jgi:hypothetical protein
LLSLCRIEKLEKLSSYTLHVDMMLFCAVMFSRASRWQFVCLWGSAVAGTRAHSDSMAAVIELLWLHDDSSH